MELTASQRRQEEKATWIGMVGNIILTIFKFAAGIFGSSEAMLADGAESLSDIIATTIVLIGLKISKRPRDASHAYGHGKAEAMATAGVGVMVIGGGVFILYHSLVVLRGGVNSAPTLIALIAALVTIIAKEGMYRYVSATGKQTGSTVLIANAWDYRKDAISSVATLFGIAGAMAGYFFLDPLVAGLVSFLIMKIGWDITRSASAELMDAMPSKPTLQEMMSLVENCSGVEHVYGIRARRMGPSVFVDLKIDVDPDLTVAEGHEIANEVKKKMIEKLESVVDVMVHVNPHYD